jgi:excinuclease ABC subunit A
LKNPVPAGIDLVKPLNARLVAFDMKIPSQRLFSFNSPFGACPRCQGFGNTIDLDMDLVIPDKNLSLNQGAIERGRNRDTGEHCRIQENRAPGWHSLGCSVSFLSPEQSQFVLNTVRAFFDYLETKKYKLHVRVFLSRYRGYSGLSGLPWQQVETGSPQHFHRWKSIADVCQMTIQQAVQFFAGVGFRNLRLQSRTNTLGNSSAASLSR